jgi:hypothetical protein
MVLDLGPRQVDHHKDLAQQDTFQDNHLDSDNADSGTESVHSAMAAHPEPHKLDAELAEIEGSEQDALDSWTPEEEKKLVRKIDLYLLPTIWLMYVPAPTPVSCSGFNACLTGTFSATWIERTLVTHAWQGWPMI